jgi:cytochrome c oxidase assembly protein subunit 15
LEDRISLFRKFAFVSTIATYLLIFIGGLVRVSGSGLGCPDWPKCFGRWIPPLSKSQIPQGFDTASFNITLAWIEYFNRLAGMITGVLILITAILAIKYFRDRKNLLIPAILAAVFVAFQGWYGSVVVKSQLMPMTVSIHMLLALVIVSLLIYTTVNAYFINRPVAGPQLKFTRSLLLFLWIVVIIQILMGTEIRSQIEIIWEKFPLLTSTEVLTNIGMVSIAHTLLGIFLMGGAVIISLRLQRVGTISKINKQGLWVMNMLVFAQILIGVSLQVMGITPLLQIFHLWLASLLIGIILVIYSGLFYQQVEK